MKINCILTYNPRTFQVKNVKIVKIFFSGTTFPVLPCPATPEYTPDGTPGLALPGGRAPQFLPFCLQIERGRTQSEAKNGLFGPKTHSLRSGKGDDSRVSINLGDVGTVGWLRESVLTRLRGFEGWNLRGVVKIGLESQKSAVQPVLTCTPVVDEGGTGFSEATASKILRVLADAAEDAGQGDTRDPE